MAKEGIPDALKNWDQLPNGAYVRLPVVSGLLGISPATVWRYVQSGRLPSPHRFGGGRCSAWSVGEIRRAMSGGA